MTFGRLVTVLAVGAVAWWLLQGGGPVDAPPDGVRVGGSPEQVSVGAASWRAKDWEIVPLARYTIQARVLGKKRYRFDWTAPIAPWDLALGWGVMSDSAVLRYLSVSQDGRWYDYWYKEGVPAEPGEIARSSANVHCLPADDQITSALNDLRVNEFVELQGWLVEARREGAPPWRSSLVRDDTGQGACEILWVTSVMQIPH